MCRDFLADPIPAEMLDHVLAAAFRGPAAGNTHGLDLVVLTGADTARHWDVTLPVERRASFRWPGLLHAPVLVEVVVDELRHPVHPGLIALQRHGIAPFLMIRICHGITSLVLLTSDLTVGNEPAHRLLHGFFFFNDPPATEIYTWKGSLSLHDALPISFVCQNRAALSLIQMEMMARRSKGIAPRFSYCAKLECLLTAIGQMARVVG